MKRYIIACLSLLTICFALASAVAESTPTPKEVISQLMGTWKGKETMSYGTTTILPESTLKIEPLGSKSLGFKVTIRHQWVGEIASLYDTGEIVGKRNLSPKDLSINGETADYSGKWSVIGRTININATESHGALDYMTSEQKYELRDDQTLIFSGIFTPHKKNSPNLIFAPLLLTIEAKKIVVSTPIITFTQPISPIAYSYGANFPLAATSTSGGTITYSSSSPSVISVAGKTATIRGVGTAVLTAKVAATGNYSASATRSVTVKKITPTVTFTQPLTPVAYAAGKMFLLEATSTSGGTVTYSSSNPNVITVAGYIATVKGKGSAIITAKVAATANYNAAAATRSVTVK